MSIFISYKRYWFEQSGNVWWVSTYSCSQSGIATNVLGGKLNFDHQMYKIMCGNENTLE